MNTTDDRPDPFRDIAVADRESTKRKVDALAKSLGIDPAKAPAAEPVEPGLKITVNPENLER
jgi:hypothetical protein